MLPWQLDCVPRYGIESLCSILRLCTWSRALWPVSASPSSHSPATRPLQFCPHSFLSPSFSSVPSLPNAPYVLFLSLALAINFPFPFSDPTLVSLAQIVSSFALRPTYIRVSIWSYFELPCYFFPKQTSHYNHCLNEIYSDTHWKCMFSIAVPYLQIYCFNYTLFWIYTHLF